MKKAAATAPPAKSSSKAKLLLGDSKDKGDTEKGKRSNHGGDDRSEDAEPGFFCSELVAACLQQMKILKDERTASYFWPVSLSQSLYPLGVCARRSTATDACATEHLN